ncbi:MAG TPA: tetratricopeptide repeat protein [Gemmatimonadales bacterium]|nr:tetratricopeptide repeat protein [Gemmatimonadales bacterium]
MTVRQAVVVVWIGTVLAAAPAAAQWAPPRCELKPGHYLVNSGLLYVRNASNTKYEDQKQKDLHDAERVLTQAVTTGGQQDNGAAWYYIARRYVLLNDLAGADSAFRRAEQLAPQCAQDIQIWRRFLWTPIYNKGVHAFQAGSTDSALHYFRQANLIHREPAGLSAMAALFANAGEIDSAAHYYGEVVRVTGSDSAQRRLRREAMFNRGALYNQARRWAESEAAFREYLAESPGDVQALAGLATAFAQTGRTDSALAMYQVLLAHADEAEPRHLFAAGVAMFNAAPDEPDSGAIWDRCRDANRPAGRATPAQTRQLAATCSAAARDSMSGWRAASRQYFRGAAGAFEAGLVRSPGNRDGLFNLVNTLYRLQDTVKMLSAAQQLYRADPMSRNTLRLLAAAWQLQGKTDSTLHYLEIAETGLAAEVTITLFTVAEDGAQATGMVTSLREQPIPAMTLAFEFLDAKGGVVVAQNVEVPALDAGASHALSIPASGAGITAWRYRLQ